MKKAKAKPKGNDTETSNNLEKAKANSKGKSTEPSKNLEKALSTDVSSKSPPSLTIVNDLQNLPSSKAVNTSSDTGFTPVNKKICTHYKKNQCKFGLKGKGCPFSRPERCKKFLAHGTKQPGGAILGKTVPSFILKCVHLQ